MSQNFRFAAAKIRLFLIPTIFFGQNFSNILYLFDNQFKISASEIPFGNGVCHYYYPRRLEMSTIRKLNLPPLCTYNKASIPFGNLFFCTFARILNLKS